MEFFNNTNNEKLKFKVNSEGININKIEPRLILTTSENVNYFFIGKMKNDVCEFDIPELNLYEKNDNGKIKFEIISEDLYFPVWSDNFEIKTRANVKIEEMFTTEHKQPIKPKITTDIIFEKTEKYDDSKKINIPDKKIVENKEIINRKRSKPKDKDGYLSFKSFSEF